MKKSYRPQFVFMPRVQNIASIQLLGKKGLKMF